MLTEVTTPMIIALVVTMIVGFTAIIIMSSWGESKCFIFGSIMVAIVISIFCGFLLFDEVQKMDKKLAKLDKEVNEEIKQSELNTEIVHTLIANELKIPSNALLIEPEEDFYKVTSSKGVYKFYFSYDQTGKVIGIKEMIQVTK